MFYETLKWMELHGFCIFHVVHSPHIFHTKMDIISCTTTKDLKVSKILKFHFFLKFWRLSLLSENQSQLINFKRVGNMTSKERTLYCKSKSGNNEKA